MADPQVMQQFDTMTKPNTNEEGEDYAKDSIQQFNNNEEPNTNEEDYTEIEDS